MFEPFGVGMSTRGRAPRRARLTENEPERLEIGAS
jgi:hypothetical protein